jgi:rare lipoprotein A (peptidoglycan hydrolase)
LPTTWKRGAFRAAAILAALGLSACATRGVGPFRVWAPAPTGTMRQYDEQGVASWYSYPPHTRRTANGEWFDARALTAAHRTLPLPSLVEVTNLENGRSVRVLVNDRGPFANGRIIDLSRAAAERLGFIDAGTAQVRVRLIQDVAEVAPPARREVAFAVPDPLFGLRGKEGIGLRGKL